MSDNALAVITPSLPLSYTCKDAIPTPESSSGLLVDDSLCYLMERIEAIGHETCMRHCFGCRKVEFEKAGKNINPVSSTYSHLTKTLHNAFRKLPGDVFSTIAAPANGRCPACIIVEALKSLKYIAFRSSSQPLGYETFPCYWEPCEFGDAIIGPDAIVKFNIMAPEIRGMAPEKKKEIRGTVLPAQSIITKIREYAAGEKEELSTADLWTLLNREAEIASLDRPPSFEWTLWAKDGFLKSGCSNHGEHMSVVLSVAFSCYSALYGSEVRSISYESLNELYAAAYYLSSGKTINEREFETIFREAIGTFISFTEEDWNIRYYSQTVLGKTFARKYIGAPPPFFCAVTPEMTSAPTPQPLEIISPVVVDSHDVNDFDVPVDIEQANQQNQSLNIEDKSITQSASKSDATGGKGGDGGDAKAVAAPENNSNLIVDVKEGAVQNNSVVHNHMADPANLADVVGNKVNEAWEKAMAVNHRLVTPTPHDPSGGKPADPFLDVDDGENGGTNPNRLIEGAVIVVVRGDIEDGDAIFQEAHIALDGARGKTRQITFLDRNGQHDAAKRLLIHLAGTGGKLNMEAVKGICIDAKLKDTMAGNVRDQLDKQICEAAGFPTKGKGRPKAFVFDAATREYITKLSFTVHSADDNNHPL